jgi:hypothetical protein
MTGPPYPRPARGAPFGGAPIGGFVIGVSPIGSIPSFDPWTTIISQYANSPILDTMILNFAQCMDQTINFDAFFDNMLNIVTAKGYGLDVWGRIVGVTRTVNIGTGGKFLGFVEATTVTSDPWNQSPWYMGQGVTNNVALSDDAFRLLILAKAFANICNDSIPAINKVLLTLFPGRGNCFVTDGQNMTMTYTFSFALTTTELAILGQSGVLPKPAGVAATIVHP